MVRLSVIVRIFALFILAWAPSAYATGPVLVLGDSLSAGYGLEPGESWVDLLADRLRELPGERGVVNASISGDTTRGGMSRLPRALKVHSPSVVVIELGGNDGLRAIPLGEIRRNLTRMIQMSRDAGADVLLVGMRIPPNYGPAYADGFHAIFHELADEQGVPLVPFFLDGVALDDGLMQDDGIHPNARAQPRMLETVWLKLERLVGETTG